ncbi:hypothetical protein C8F04DRAFT_1313200 [Mycena alexandri]|uniref:Uncharacterized protein n=1 Tax=Mycena alexandri TaxID=1745969 RepID=A0AAD6WSD9_9AGAR|nr:hypothetical protein C8F04DRAFT_1313200 [Mycena alexandri]
MITMRGAERPAKVQWSRPFLLPLQPLAQDAARKMFINIVDERHSLDEIDQVLSLTDNMQLSINLLAHLVDIEGCTEILSRWDTEKTSLISEGHDRRSNLELSISLSLSSPRIASMPYSQDLLALLSLLPDGLSDVELKQSKFPIKDILGCKIALLRTALVYTDDRKCIKVLVPIREYMGRLFPPTDQMIQLLLKHFHELLESYGATVGTRSGMAPIDRITSNYTNIQNILQTSLHREYHNVVDVIYCICDFNWVSLCIGHGATTLLEDITNLLPSLEDHRLKVYLITELVQSWRNHPISHPELLIIEALNHFKDFDDPDLEGSYYFQHNHKISAALQHGQIALSLAKANRNLRGQCDALHTLGELGTFAGDHTAARAYAQEEQMLANICGDLWKEACGLYIEAISLQFLGEYQECMTLTIRARTILGLCGLSHGQLNYGLMQFKPIFTGLNLNIYQQGLALINIAEIELLMGVSKTEIQKKIEASQVIFRASNNAMLDTACETIQADLNFREGDMSSLTFGKCLKLGWGMYSELTKERLAVHKALQFLGDVCLRENDEVTAISLFILALEGFTQMDVHRSRAECMIRLGDISKKNNNLLKALEFWETARLLFERSSQVKQVWDIDERLVGIGENVKEQYKRNLAQLAELNALTGKVEELDEDLSEDEFDNEETTNNWLISVLRKRTEVPKGASAGKVWEEVGPTTRGMLLRTKRLATVWGSERYRPLPRKGNNFFPGDMGSRDVVPFKQVILLEGALALGSPERDSRTSEDERRRTKDLD